jgi:prenyltransferase beta subunit
MAATARVVLQTSIQTHEFVAQWQNQSNMLWTTKSKINKEIERKIRDLQQAVSKLGDQIVSMQHQLMLLVTGMELCILLLQQNIMLPNTIGNKKITFTKS